MAVKNQLTRNSKIKLMTGDYTVNFGIPAKKTCPMHDICGAFCYATKGAYTWPVVIAAYEARFQLSKQENFSDIIVKELDRRKKIKRIRIHDSGDFYSDQYLNKWIKIAQQKSNIAFYAYTKCIERLKSVQLPNNFTIIYSLGGKQDYLIDQNLDRHSKIFKTKQELLDAGYVDASKNDELALGPIKKIGLVEH